MAVLATQAKRINDLLFIEAAYAAADAVTDDQLSHGSLYPAQSNILAVELQAAERIAKSIFDQLLARVSRPKNLQQLIEKYVYVPDYTIREWYYATFKQPSIKIA